MSRAIVFHFSSRHASAQAIQIHDRLPPKIIVVHYVDGVRRSFGQRRRKPRRAVKLQWRYQTACAAKTPRPALVRRTMSGGPSECTLPIRDGIGACHLSDRILERRRLDLSALQIERKNLDRFEGSSVPLATATPTGTRALQLRTESLQTPGQYWIPAAMHFCCAILARSSPVELAGGSRNGNP
jgi:hypothetical protein